MDWLRGLFAPKTVVALRRPSSDSRQGGSWESGISYDHWGSPYVKQDDRSSLVRLKPSGETFDTLYHTEWKHLRGPPVDFPQADRRSD